MRSKRPIYRIARTAGALALIAGVTAFDGFVFHVNATTAGFSYLVAILLVAAYSGGVEAIAASFAAVGCFNFFFLPPLFTFTIADSRNAVALVALLTTALVASRLAAQAREQTTQALDRQREMELLYALSRAILISGPGEDAARRIALDLARIFEFKAVVLLDARTGRSHNAGPEEFDAPAPELDRRLRDAALSGTSLHDEAAEMRIFSVRLGGRPIGSLAVSPPAVSETAMESMANLVAIALERARGMEEANRLEAERQSGALKSTLLDAIAHEFKTPLTSIKAAASLFAFRPLPSTARIEELGSVINEESDRLERLVSEAIQMARLESGQVTLQTRPLQTRAVIESAIAHSRSALDGRPVHIAIDGDAEAFVGDEALLEVALRQLLDNAGKYSSPGAPVEVHAATSADGLCIQVRDSGPGIPEAEQSRLFERFYRAPGAGGRAVGSGMGLNIAREILRAHGGSIRVESQPGAGSIFSLSLPAARVPAHAEEAPSAPREPQ